MTIDLEGATDVPERATVPTETTGLLTTLPTQRPAPDLDLLPVGTRRSRGLVVGSVVALVVLALAGAGVVAGDQAHDRRVASAESAARAADAARAARAAAVVEADRRLAATSTALAARLAHAQGAAQAAVDGERTTVGASPNAAATLRDAAATAAGRVTSLLATATTTPQELDAAVAALVAAEALVEDAQAAYVTQQAGAAAAAKAAAIARAATATRSAAAGHAAGQARPSGPTKPAAKPASAKPASAKPVSAKPATRSAPKPAKSTGTSRAGATGALASVPAGGLRCTGDGSGAAGASVSALGSAINAYRSAHGLSTLRVVASSSLKSHALQMANTGGIWHSGHDNIVGCVSNGSYSYLVKAWDASKPHRAQMRRTGITTMYVGDALRGGWLYGAVFFD